MKPEHKRALDRLAFAITEQEQKLKTALWVAAEETERRRALELRIKELEAERDDLA